ncbi:MAG: outer rane biosis protein [Armatimonadetes bacterium]|nr:outer rane biosis protein [Armatimonadota bacterium]
MRTKLGLRALVTATLAAGLGAAAATPGDNWAQFRGPGARGVSERKGLPDRWSATENVAWKTDLPGRGWSSPIVWGDRVFLTTVVNQGQTEEPKKGLYFGGDRPTPPPSVHVWKVYCLDVRTGKVRWERTVFESKPNTPRHLKNSYASETPVTDGERVYAYFGNLGVFCFDMDGKPVWSKRLEPHATRFGWGTAASPVLHRDRLYLVNDNEERSSLAALDKRTGKEIWRVERDEKSNWATPYVWESGGRTEIVTPGSGQVRSYDLNGKLLWWLEGMSSITIATPYAADGLLYVSSGYVGSPLRPLYAIRPGAEGNISLGREERSNRFIAWCDWRGAPYNPSTLAYDGRLYVLFDRGLFGAYRAKEGTPLFDKERIPNGANFTASPWAYDGKVFCLSEEGTTFVIRGSDRFEVLRTNTLAEDDMCMSTPAIAGNRLLIRTSSRLYCIAAPRTARELPARATAE